MVNSRRKGHDAELKVAGMLHRHTGETLHKRLAQAVVK